MIFTVGYQLSLQHTNLFGPLICTKVIHFMPEITPFKLRAPTSSGSELFRWDSMRRKHRLDYKRRGEVQSTRRTLRALLRTFFSSRQFFPSCLATKINFNR
jgi:hypothetical protein